MMQVVLLSGKMGSGKDTTAEAIRALYKHQSHVKVAFAKFATPLYEMHNECLRILSKYGINRDIKKDGTLLQLLGTEWGRKTLGEDIWVKMCQNNVRYDYEDYIGLYDRVIVVITDARFENEFHAFPEALRVRLEADRDIRKERCSQWRENEHHPSETGLDEYQVAGCFDMTFWTDGSNTPEHIATLIAAQLDKNVWIEKRQEHQK